MSTQNFSVYFDGVKTNDSTVKKKGKRGGLGGRKALNDISNSGKPPALNNTLRKQNPNVIPIGEDLGVFKKTQLSGSRKALGDLTNSVKPLTQQQQSLKKKNEGKNSIHVEEEGFLHNHDECVTSQNKLLDLDFNPEDMAFCHNHDECVRLQKKLLDLDFDQFFKELDDIEDVSVACKDENVSMFVEMEEMPEMEEIPEYEVCHFGERSPMFGSPISSGMSEDPLDYDELPSPCFTALTESPKGSK